MNAKTENANTDTTATVTVKAEVKKLVKTLTDSGKPYTAIHTVLTALGHAASGKEADAILATLKVEKSTAKKNIVDSMYDYLEAAPRTQADFHKWVEENGTANTIRWFTSHDKVRILTNKLHTSLTGVEFKDVPYVAPATK